MLLNQEMKDRLVAELRAGTPVPAVATKLNIPYNQVYAYAKRLKKKGLKMRAPVKKAEALKVVARPMGADVDVLRLMAGQVSSDARLDDPSTILDRITLELLHMKLSLKARGL